MIKQIGLPLRGRPILLITRMITDRIGFHSVLLPLLITVFAGVLFVHQLGTNHAPRVSVTQVNHSVHTLSRRVNETFFLSSEDSDKTKIAHFKCATKITEY